MGGEQLAQRPGDGHKVCEFPEMKGHSVREGGNSGEADRGGSQRPTKQA